MKIYIHKWIHTWKALLKSSTYRWSLGVGLFFFVLAYAVNYYITLYTQNVEVISVGDLILDNIPTIDLSFIFIFGIFFVAFLLFVYPVFIKPELVPFTAKTLAAFILIRAFFISLTHLGAPLNYYNLAQFSESPSFFQYFYLNDLFFSAHTGLPYLGALLFWENRIMRYLLLGMSVLQALTVLFMHVHYSIDVFSAYFITYTIYIVSDRVFNHLNVRFKEIALSIEQKLQQKLKELKKVYRNSGI